MRRPVTRLAPCPERRLDPSLYAVAEQAALSAHTPWEAQSSDPAAGSGGHQRRRNRGFQLSLSCSSSSSSSGRHSVVIALLTRAPDRSDLRGEGFTYGQIAIHG